MSNKPALPASLVVVAWLFIISGILAVIEVIWALANGRISINLAVLCIFVGIGLLRLSRAWRIVALVFLWFVLLACPFVLIFGKYHGNIFLAIALVLAVFSLAAWQYWVLTRPHIRALFGL